MESRFNIPAPAVVKLCCDICVETGRRLKVTVPQGDAEASGQGGSVKACIKKNNGVFPRLPVPQTDTGGWVEYTQARE